MSDRSIIPAAALGSGISFILSAISYYKYQQSKQTLNIPHFKTDQQLLQEVQKYKRLYAAVEGKVESVGQPLKTNRVPECYGVIHKVTTREQQVFAVPFCLVPQDADRTAHVHVESPLEAEGDYLQEVHSRPEQNNNEHQNVQEKLLAVNSVLTGVGDVVMSQRCAGMVLEPPADGRKFFLFSGGYDSVKKRHETKSKLLMVMSVAGAMTGAMLSAFIYSKLNTEKKRN